MADSEIREGFLCPICVKDLGTISQLQQHFEDEHSTEDKAVLQQLKGLFGKAKRKILAAIDSDEEDTVDSGPSGHPGSSTAVSQSVDAGGIDPTLWEPQEIGCMRSHTDFFKPIRDARIDRYVVETNKLIIRLDKLVGPDVPSDPSRRKIFEKKVVQWAPDSHVNLCMTCGKSFGIMRRRHHCRLCGGVMCDKCSEFLSFSYAKKLTDPAFKPGNDTPLGIGFRRSNSTSSLNSMMTPEGEPHIRICWECRKLLERRAQQMEHRNSRPVIGQFYEKMRQHMETAEQLIPVYTQAAESLNLGEATYNLADAEEQKRKLVKLYEQIDALSKRISSMGLNDTEPPPAKMVQLQKAIRFHASQFIQENLMGLTPLPTQEQLVQLQAKRKAEIQRKIMLERQATMERQEKEKRAREEKERKQQEEIKRHQRKSSNDVIRVRSPSRGHQVPNKGWMPPDQSKASAATPDDDPMVQQMNNIKHYIKQAKDAQKWDEVHMLEENLKMLQSEFWRQSGFQN
ncbi:rabenosyn-5-like [Lingula anatina]|uniref:Rabenosyn-5-like n=1 Tax=Lingula anatina TaxID=7574 RepID=A0A1S3K517_LINAN|nr:rabenosyn-5-like [Lingula anatina]|eukprot:XP_013417356.1 rabenosyn-5-like [Lingula anatina]